MRISDWSSDVCSSDLRRVVGVELGGLQSFLADAAHDGIEQMRGLAGPAGEGRTIDVDALRRHHLCLAIEGQMVIELVHDDMGERREAGLAACYGLHRRRCLDDPVAGAAAILGPHGADNAPLDRRDVELLIAVVPERTQRAARSEEHTSELQSLMRNSY